MASADAPIQTAPGSRTRKGSTAGAAVSSPSDRSARGTETATAAPASTQASAAGPPPPRPILSNHTKISSAPGGWPAVWVDQTPASVWTIFVGEPCQHRGDVGYTRYFVEIFGLWGEPGGQTLRPAVHEGQRQRPGHRRRVAGRQQPRPRRHADPVHATPQHEGSHSHGRRCTPADVWAPLAEQGCRVGPQAYFARVEHRAHDESGGDERGLDRQGGQVRAPSGGDGWDRERGVRQHDGRRPSAGTGGAASGAEDPSAGRKNWQCGKGFVRLERRSATGIRPTVRV
jgi:hypothetical protein